MSRNRGSWFDKLTTSVITGDHDRTKLLYDVKRL